MTDIIRRLFPLLLLGAAGCASIVSGTTQTVSFHSNPEGATVMVDGTTLGKTPLSMSLKKGKYRSVSFEKEGYKKLVLPMESRTDGWFWGNIVLGGLLGSTTDGVSGAAHEYSPGQYMVSLEPLHASRMEVEVNKGEKQKAREFLIIAYRNVVGDIAKGKGEYLQSAYSALGVAKEAQAEAHKKLRALSEAYEDIPTFADKAVEMFLTPSSSAPPERSWDEVKNAGVQERYAFLASVPLYKAQEIVRGLDDGDRRPLTAHVLETKGRKGNMSWSFEPAKELAGDERALVVWMVSSYSEYKP